MEATTKLSIAIGVVATCVIQLPLGAQEYIKPHSQLSVSPNICIVKTLGQPCSKPIQITWSTPAPANYCLFIQGKKYKCWTARQQVSEALLVGLKVSSTFDLRNEKNQVVATSTVVVNGATSKRFRRRLRADWSVF